MANQESAPQPLPQPIARNPKASVENIYPVPGTADQQDVESQGAMQEYLRDRFRRPDDERITMIMEPTGRHWPGITLKKVGTKEVTRFRKVDPREWLVSPKQALGVVLGSLALANFVSHLDTIGGAVDWTAHKGYRVIDPVDTKVSERKVPHTTPGTTETFSVTAHSVNKVGESTISAETLSTFISKVKSAEQKNIKTEVDIEVQALTSDEAGGDSTIGVADEFNHDLGLARGDKALAKLHEGGLTADDGLNFHVTTKENILSQKIKQMLRSEAQAEGFASIQDAIRAVDGGQEVKPSLAKHLKKWITSARGVKLIARVKSPGKSETTTDTIVTKEREEDHTPDIPPGKFVPWLIPMLPIRRREKYKDIRDKRRLRFTPYARIHKPRFIREDKLHAWVRLRPEALKDDKTLADHPWAYTRIYEDIMRDDRIQEVLRADFENPDGEAKSIRVLFIDHKPPQETVEMFEDLLTKLAAMKKGKFADKISAITVFPSENAGNKHRNPKRIGLGVDKQRNRGILGTCTPILKLVEMHMPTKFDSVDDILAMLGDPEGPTWTAAHETAGHGTDISDEKRTLYRVNAIGIPNAHLISGETWLDSMQPLQDKLKDLDSVPGPNEKDPVKFDIEYTIVDADGNQIPISDQGDRSDPRLPHTTKATIVGSKPTWYSSEAPPLEHYAETAAAVTTGMSIPFNQSGAHVKRITLPNGQLANIGKGYRPDVRGQKLFVKAVGGIEGSYPIAFENAPDVSFTRTEAENDPLLREEMTRTRSIRTLRPGQMIAILAGRIDHEKKR